jgi:hypothetical protein
MLQQTQLKYLLDVQSNLLSILRSPRTTYFDSVVAECLFVDSHGGVQLQVEARVRENLPVIGAWVQNFHFPGLQLPVGTSSFDSSPSRNLRYSLMRLQITLGSAILLGTSVSGLVFSISIKRTSLGLISIRCMYMTLCIILTNGGAN